MSVLTALQNNLVAFTFYSASRTAACENPAAEIRKAFCTDTLEKARATQKTSQINKAAISIDNYQ